MLHFHSKCNLLLFLSILQALSRLSPEDLSVFPADWSPARGCSSSWCPLCSALPLSSGHRPQQSRRAKRCREGVVHLCVWPWRAQGRRVKTKVKCSRGIMCLILRRRASQYSHVVHHSFPVLLSHVFFFNPQWFCRVSRSTSVTENFWSPAVMSSVSTRNTST